jgi:glycosyltransferase involved in cell wall biosynthesis
MRILQLAQFYPPIVGGEERHVFNLAGALAALGHEVHVATLDVPGTDATPEQEGVTVHRLDNAGRRIPALYPSADRPLALPIPDPIVTRALQRLISEIDPDVVHAHNWIINSLLPLPAVRRRPLVYSLHDYSHVCATKRLMYEGQPCSGPSMAKCHRCAGGHYGRGRGDIIATSVRVGRPVRNRVVDLFTPVSGAVAEGSQLDAMGAPWTRVPNFIPDELTTLETLPRDEALPESAYLFFAGDLSSEKGVPTLLSAWEALPQATRPALVLVGRPLDGLPADLPAGVTVGHHWDHERVLSGFQHALAAVLPSEWPDPCPTTVLEAMAVGAPLVTTHQGGIRDMVVDDESALVVPPGDVAALTAALARVTGDAELRDRLRAGAATQVRGFLRTSVADQLSGIYTGLVEEYGAPGARPRGKAAAR